MIVIGRRTMEVLELLWFGLALTTVVLGFRAFERYLLMRSIESVMGNADNLVRAFSVAATVLRGNRPISLKLHERECHRGKGPVSKMSAFGCP